MTKYPFYSRKYKTFFKSYGDFERFLNYETRKRIIEKQAGYKGKAYIQKGYRKGYKEY